MRIIHCPACGTPRKVSMEELKLIIVTNQFMCWEVCGMDICIPPMHLFFNSNWEGDAE